MGKQLKVPITETHCMKGGKLGQGCQHMVKQGWRDIWVCDLHGQSFYKETLVHPDFGTLCSDFKDRAEMGKP